MRYNCNNSWYTENLIVCFICQQCLEQSFSSPHMEERFSLLIKVEHKAHWVIDLCHRPVWCLAKDGEKERDRGRERQSDRHWQSCSESWPVSFTHSLPTCDYIWDGVCAYLPESTLILPFVCIMIKTKGGVNTKEKRIFPIPCYLKMTPIVLLFSFFLFGGELGRGVELFLSDLGNKCGGGTLRGRCSGCACPRLIRNILGPDWTVPVPSWETPPPRERLLTKRLERLEIRAFSTRQGRVPSKLRTQSFNT